MDCDSGNIHYFDDDEALEEAKRAYRQRVGKELLPLSKELSEKLEPLVPKERKGYMRNKPCVCGSGKKFKKCCWSKYA